MLSLCVENKPQIISYINKNESLLRKSQVVIKEISDTAYEAQK